MPRNLIDVILQIGNMPRFEGIVTPNRENCGRILLIGNMPRFEGIVTRHAIQTEQGFHIGNMPRFEGIVTFTSSSHLPRRTYRKHAPFRGDCNA